MFEFGLGVILATLFVAAYLIITTYFRRDSRELDGLHPSVTLNPMDTTHSIGAGKSRRALTSGEGHESRSPGTKHRSSDDQKP